MALGWVVLVFGSSGDMLVDARILHDPKYLIPLGT